MLILRAHFVEGIVQLRHHHAAVDVDRLAGDPPACIGEQEADDVADVFGLTDASKRDIAGALVHHLLRSARTRQRRVRDTRGQGIHANIVRQPAPMRMTWSAR